jgi:hypothetical protein
MKLLHKLALSAVAFATLSVATPAQAFWWPFFPRHVVVSVGVPAYAGYYGPAYYGYYAPPVYYGYYGPYYHRGFYYGGREYYGGYRGGYGRGRYYH